MKPGGRASEHLPLPEGLEPDLGRERGPQPREQRVRCRHAGRQVGFDSVMYNVRVPGAPKLRGFPNSPVSRICLPYHAGLALPSPPFLHAQVNFTTKEVYRHPQFYYIGRVLSLQNVLKDLGQILRLEAAQSNTQATSPSSSYRDPCISGRRCTTAELNQAVVGRILLPGAVTVAPPSEIELDRRRNAKDVFLVFAKLFASSIKSATVRSQNTHTHNMLYYHLRP